MDIDVARARAETPGCARVVHLNNAGAALPPQPVLDTVVDHLRREALTGGYEAHEDRVEEFAATYQAIAALLNAHPEEIAVVENATRAWDMAFYSIPFRPGDRILTSAAEYASNAIPYLQVARRHGVRVEFVPDDEHGQLSVEALRSMLDERVRLIAVTHVPTHNGLVNPVEKIGEVAREAGVLYLVDACQSAGQVRLDVEAIGCDMLSATGRKYLRGPRGTGFLYVSQRVLDELEPPFLDLHAATWVAPDRYEIRGDARRFENWESYRAGQLGLGAAVRYALELGMPAIESRVAALGERLRALLAELPEVTVHDRGERRCGIVTFSVAGHDPDDLKPRLRARGFNVSVSAATSAQYDFTSKGLPPRLVRASVHYYNTEDELDRFCGALRELVRG
ncbi:aminotransferase class V [Carbonactinospora thermoautotrophica]|uniref:Aminotransferase class V n=1 Tax=Carbonactinospora thermoautotrophica TaxID=1469144 RepID=A0A132MLR5_9ACTN|nr:aminotransferase class V-fold PLP-dependent enzyme [Carbonactinospora thermoautotrophica]KWW97461.1 aminotransferase class V [Carbonactinospora thermoautotrophica]KWW98733.1 Cysteine desulfurase [Carbonactinospora thermoautotrophica]KWX08093.1 aminotransferase class V [Carbonactinospora thermoautotrophica]